MEQAERSDTNESRKRGVEKFKGPKYLTRFEPDPDALAVLADIDSVTSTRLHKRSRGEWPGIISIEDYLGPLAQSEGEIVLRVVDTPGNQWVWWRGETLGKHQYRRVGALPHYQEHKIVNRRNGHVNRLTDLFESKGSIIPIHRDNAPQSIQEYIENDSY